MGLVPFTVGPGRAITAVGADVEAAVICVSDCGLIRPPCVVIFWLRPASGIDPGRLWT